jgi:hypothetical protein
VPVVNHFHGLLKILSRMGCVVVPQMGIADLHDRNLVVAIVPGAGGVLTQTRRSRNEVQKKAQRRSEQKF